MFDRIFTLMTPWSEWTQFVFLMVIALIAMAFITSMTGHIVVLVRGWPPAPLLIERSEGTEITPEEASTSRATPPASV